MKAALISLFACLPAIGLSLPADDAKARLMESLRHDLDALRAETPVRQERVKAVTDLISDLDQVERGTSWQFRSAASRALVEGSRLSGDRALDFIRITVASGGEERSARLSRANKEILAGAREAAAPVLGAGHSRDLVPVKEAIGRLQTRLRIERIESGPAWREVADLQTFVESWQAQLEQRQAYHPSTAMEQLDRIAAAPTRIPDRIDRAEALREIATARLDCSGISDQELLARISGLMGRAMAANHPQEIEPLLSEASALPLYTYPQLFSERRAPRESLISALKAIRDTLVLVEQHQPGDRIVSLIRQTNISYGNPLFRELGIPRSKVQSWLNSFTTPPRTPAAPNR